MAAAPGEIVRLLLLGGTGDAAILARRLADDPRLHVVTSLAGRTRSPAGLIGEVRTGGFGGAEGLAAYLKEESVGLVVDATHPFANQMATNAALASTKTEVPRLKLLRPAWIPVDGDSWTVEQNLADAAAHLEGSYYRRVFLSVGRQDLSAFAGLEDIWFLVRTIETLESPCPLARCELIQGRGPFSESDEIDLLEEHRIDLLVSKNSGGAATYAKIAAARRLGLPVMMVERPPAPAGKTVETIAQAIDWIDAHLTDA